MKTQVPSIFNDYKFLHRLDVSDGKYFPKDYKRYEDRVKCWRDNNKVITYKDQETGEIFRREKHDDTARFRIITDIGKFSIVWSLQDKKNIKAHTFFNGVEIDIKIFLEAFYGQKLPAIESYFDRWEDVIFVFNNVVQDKKRITVKNHSDGGKTCVDNVLGHQVCGRRIEKSPITNPSGFEYIVARVGDIIYRFEGEGNKYFINDEPIDEKTFKEFFIAKIAPSNNKRDIRFNNLAFLKQLEAMSSKDIAERYKDEIIEQPVKSKKVSNDEVRRIVSPKTGEIFFVIKGKDITIYYVTAEVGTYSICYFNDTNDIITTFNDSRIEDREIFFDAFSNQRVPDLPPIFGSWETGVLSYRELEKKYDGRRLRHNGLGWNLNNNETCDTYIDTFYGHKLEILGSGEPYYNQKFIVYIDGIVYEYIPDPLEVPSRGDTYIINGEMCSKEVFIGCFKLRTVPSKIRLPKDPLRES